VKLLTPSVTVAVCTAVPLVPVTVNVEFAPGVVEVVLTVMVEVPAPPVMVAGLNEAVAPAGRPLTVGVTVPVNPFCAVTVTVYVVLPPAVTVCVVGLTESAKFRTVSVAVAVFDLDPLVPVTVSVEFAPGVAEVVVTVMVEVPAPVMVAGLNEAVAPAGRPLTVGVTTPLNPFTAVVVTVYVVLPPATTVWVLGVTATVKSTTLKVTGVVCTSDPFVPLIVRVELAVGVLLAVVTVSVDVPVLPVIVLGLKLAVAPVGSPVTVNATLPVSPFIAVLVIV